MRQASGRSGLTAVEVLASTLLAAMLMTALLSVLRGLKTQEEMLAIRAPTVSWKQSLAAALQNDLETSHTYVATPKTLTLSGYSGRATESSGRNWLPGSVVYDVRATKERSWLARRESAVGASGASSSDNLVLAGVDEIRVGRSDSTHRGDGREAPVVDGLTLEFWKTNGIEPLFRYRHRRP